MTGRRIAAAAALFALAACSGGGGTVPRASAPPPGGRANASLVIHWTSPTAAAAAAARHARTISPSAQSIVSYVNGIKADITNRGGAAESLVNLDAPVGTDAFSFKIYDTPGGQGNLLGAVDTTQLIVAGSRNVISAVVEAVCAATYTTAIPTHTFVIYTKQQQGGTLLPSSIATAEVVGPGTGQLSVSAVDADGNLIARSAGSVAVNVGAASPVPAGSVSVTSPTTVTLQGHPSPVDAYADVSVAVPGCPATLFRLTSSSEILLQYPSATAVRVLDKYGTAVMDLSTTGRLIGFIPSGGPVLYNGTTGAVTASEPDGSSPRTLFTSYAGASCVTWLGGRTQAIAGEAVISSANYLFVQSSSFSNAAPYAGTCTKAAGDLAFGQSFYLGDGTHIARYDTAPNLLASRTAAATFNGLTLEPYDLVAYNAAAPYISRYDQNNLNPQGSGSGGLTAPAVIAAGDQGDYWDQLLYVYTSSGAFQAYSLQTATALPGFHPDIGIIPSVLLVAPPQ